MSSVCRSRTPIATGANTARLSWLRALQREGEGGPLLWVVMITSAENRAWPDDHPISAFGEVGLPIPSVVRPAKITTVEASDAERIGHLDAPFMQRVLRTVEAFLKPPS